MVQGAWAQGVPTWTEGGMPSTATASMNSYQPMGTGPFSGPWGTIKLQEGLAEVLPQWFYPLPNEQPPINSSSTTCGHIGLHSTNSNGYVPLGMIGCVLSQDSYVAEEKDMPVPHGTNPQMEI